MLATVSALHMLLPGSNSSSNSMQLATLCRGLLVALWCLHKQQQLQLVVLVSVGPLAWVIVGGYLGHLLLLAVAVTCHQSLP